MKIIVGYGPSDRGFATTISSGVFASQEGMKNFSTFKMPPSKLHDCYTSKNPDVMEGVFEQRFFDKACLHAENPPFPEHDPPPDALAASYLDAVQGKLSNPHLVTAFPVSVSMTSSQREERIS